MDDWNGIPRCAFQSRGGVWAMCRYDENLLTASDSPWPPATLVQKCYQSRHLNDFYPKDHAALIQRLGYYTDLQSLHSEDAITWSFFGLISMLPPKDQAKTLNWICEKIGIASDNSLCETTLFRRIPHPDTLVPGGPEIDFMLHGDHCVILGEAKWLSTIAMRQGANGDKSQFQLRCDFLDKYGSRLFGSGKSFVVLAVTLDPQIIIDVDASSKTPIKRLIWNDLARCPHHPRMQEYQKYLEWKLKYR